MKWTIPAKIIARGRKYVDEGRVLRVSADEVANVWRATVVGTRDYEVTLDGGVQEVDTCECPYWEKHQYCKHTVAVELFLRKKGLNRILSQNPKMLLPRKRVVKDVDILRSALSKFSSPRQIEQRILPLKIEFQVVNISTNQYHPELDVLGIMLKIGLQTEKRTVIVKNIGTFFEKLEEQSIFRVNEHKEFLLSPQAFDEESLKLLEKLHKIYLTFEMMKKATNNQNGKIDKRYLLLPIDESKELLETMAKTGAFTLEIDGVSYDTLTFMQKKYPFSFDMNLKNKDLTLKLPTENLRVFEMYGWIVKENEIYFVETNEIEMISILNTAEKQMKSKEIHFSETEYNEFFSDFLPQLRKIGKVHVPEAMNEKLVNSELKTYLLMKKIKGNIDVRIDFHYGEQVFSTDKTQEILGNSVVLRDSEKESEIVHLLEKFRFTKTETGYQKPLPYGESLFYFFRTELIQLRKKAKVLLGKKLSEMYLDTQKLQPVFEVEEKQGWLDVRFDISGIPQEEINRVLTRLMRKEPFATLSDGKVLSLDSEVFIQTADILNDLRGSLRLENGHFQLSSARGMEVSEKLSKAPFVLFSEGFKTLLHDLNHPELIPFTLPKDLNAQLRQYQLEGVKWLKMLSNYGFGGILADEMGLGKTIQTITYLLSEKSDNWKGTALIVAPASLIYNWESEIEKFAPNLTKKVVVGHKGERERLLENGEKVDILITSYSSLRSDAMIYSRLSFGYLIMDEAQMVKNARTRTASVISSLRVRQKFALSGTPIENNLEELWNIFSILLPGLLPNRQKYRNLTTAEIWKFTKPFILRRLKSEVLRDLPEKVESNLYSTLTDEQKKVYLAYLQQMNNEITSMSSDDFKRNRMSILAGLTRLRQICDDPHLFLEDYTGESGKLEQLKEIVQVANENGRRVLVFSQFTSMLTIIEREFSAMGLESFYLRGSTKPSVRLDMVNSFNSGERDVFLISLKAGGTGLNLTGADTVILYDLWWNPAVEEQAAGRAHRIGQTKNVEVWRMIARGTIEERIHQLQSEKKELFEAVITGDNRQSNALSEEDLREILSIGE